MTLATRIQLGFVLFLIVAGTGFVVPRFAAGNETGLAASTTAAITFLGCFAAAGVIGVILLILTVRQRTTLPARAKLAGFLPLPLLAIGLIAIVLIAVRKNQERQQSDSPPRSLVPAPTVPK